MLHPLFTRTDGAASREDVFTSDVLDDWSHVGFTFEHDGELQPGPWTIVVEPGTRELTRKDFTLTAPTAPAPECSGR